MIANDPKPLMKAHSSVHLINVVHTWQVLGMDTTCGFVALSSSKVHSLLCHWETLGGQLTDSLLCALYEGCRNSKAEGSCYRCWSEQASFRERVEVPG